MGIKDKAEELKKKAAESGKADEFIQKAADKVDQATGNRFDEKTDKGAQMAKDAMRKQSSE